MNHRIYLVSIILGLSMVILLFYTRDANLERKAYIVAYESCQERMVENKAILTHINDSIREEEKAHLREQLHEMESCDGCYNSCGSPCGSKGSRNLGFIEWVAKNTIVKLKGSYGCAAVCVPYCMEAP